VGRGLSVKVLSSFIALYTFHFYLLIYYSLTLLIGVDWVTERASGP